MAHVPVREADQRAFVKVYDQVSQRFSRWDVWTDMVWLFAIEIANAVDAKHRDKRNERYKAIASKYRPDEFKGFADLFCMIVDAFEKHPFQDFLGSMYMCLGLGNSKAGQFFTPYCVCQMMADMQMPAATTMLKEQEYITINDPACGAGATLIAAAESLYANQHINYQTCAIFVGQDIDYTVGLMCYIQLSLIGAPGFVRIGDTIANPSVGHPLFGEDTDDTWYTPMFYRDVWEMRRVIERMKRITSTIQPLPPRKSYEEPPITPADPEPAGPQIIQVTGKRRGRKHSEGQLMFDLIGE